MRRIPLRPLLRVLPCLALLLAAQSVAACPSCYGAADTPVTRGLNSAVFLMLGITYAVLFGFGALFVTLGLRSRARSRLSSPEVSVR